MFTPLKIAGLIGTVIVGLQVVPALSASTQNASETDGDARTMRGNPMMQGGATMGQMMESCSKMMQTRPAKT